MGLTKGLKLKGCFGALIASILAAAQDFLLAPRFRRFKGGGPKYQLTISPCESRGVSKSDKLPTCVLLPTRAVSCGAFGDLKLKPGALEVSKNVLIVDPAIGILIADVEELHVPGGLLQ